MTRIKSDQTPGQATLAGTLGPVLTMHAAQRCQYFFIFLFAYAALTQRLNTAHGAGLGPSVGVSVKATHQIATGLRSDNAAYYDFPETDPKVVTLSATACGRTDAAHYCNLGLTAPFMLAAGAVAQPQVDPLAFAFYDLVQVMAGATRQLPQRVNIGPDRIVDQVHGVLAAQFLGAPPPLSAANMRGYLATCKAQLLIYRAQLVKEGKLGLAACCDCYIAFYDGGPTGLWSADGVWQQICGTVDAECGHHKLDRAAFLSMLVG